MGRYGAGDTRIITIYDNDVFDMKRSKKKITHGRTYWGGDGIPHGDTYWGGRGTPHGNLYWSH